MRRAILIVCAVLAIVGTVSAQTDQPLRIAVLDLTSRNVPEGELLMLTERLRVELFSTGRFTVLERDKVEQILREQGFQNSECAATECAVDIGRMIGAEKMVAGSIGSVGSQYSLIVRLIDVETGAIERTALRDCRCPIEDVMATTVRTVAGELVSAATPMPPEVVSRTPTPFVTLQPQPQVESLVAPREFASETSLDRTLNRRIDEFQFGVSSLYLKYLGFGPSLRLENVHAIVPRLLVGIAGEFGWFPRLNTDSWGSYNTDYRSFFSIGVPLVIPLSTSKIPVGVDLRLSPTVSYGPFSHVEDWSGSTGFNWARTYQFDAGINVSPRNPRIPLVMYIGYTVVKTDGYGEHGSFNWIHGMRAAVNLSYIRRK